MSKKTLLMLNFCYLPLTYALPNGFVYVHEVAPSIIEDIRYAGINNFTGHTIPSYKAALCILTKKAAQHLADAQQEANQLGYNIKVYDCYRPQTAVNAFYRWSQDERDLRTKKYFYPREDKKLLFARGYIAKSSGHTRGSTVDLSLVKINTSYNKRINTSSRCYGKSKHYIEDNSFDTGTRFDCFDVAAHYSYTHLTKKQKENRLLLRVLMMKHGFTPYDKEWWHFTLSDEPYPNRYFDFPVS